MQFFLFVLSLAVVVGIVGFGAWAFAQSLVYMSQQMHRGIVFFVRSLIYVSQQTHRVIIFAVNSLNSAVGKLKRLAKAQFKVRSKEVEKPSTQVQKCDESDEDWSVYDIPTYLRKGKVLVW